MKKGEELLLFLSLRNDGKTYDIVGTQVYGKYYYDKKKDEIYRLKFIGDIADYSEKKAEKLMISSRGEFEALVKESMNQ